MKLKHQKKGGWDFYENPLFDRAQYHNGRRYWDYERFEKEPNYFREFKQTNMRFDWFPGFIPVIGAL